MIQVFHGKSFREICIANEKGPKAIYDLIMDGCYERVAAVDTDDLEVAFDATNNYYRGWTENFGASNVQVIGDPRKRSTSCGDIMLRGEEFYYVADFGFTKINYKVPVGHIKDAE